MKNEIVVKNVVHEYSYYDAGADYYMEGAIYWNDEKQEFAYKTFREGDYEIEYIKAPEEIQKKWKEHLDKLEKAIERFQDLRNSNKCPICGEEMHDVKADWVLRKLQTRRAKYCPNCKINVVVHVERIAASERIVVYKNLKFKTHLYCSVGGIPEEYYLASPEEINREIDEFLDDLNKLKEVEE